MITSLLVSCTPTKPGVTSGGSASIKFTTPDVTTAVFTPEPTATKITRSPNNSNQVDAAIMTAAKAQLAARSWRVTSKIESNGQSVQGTLDYVAPDRYHLTSSLIEAISIGSKTYLLQNGKWTETPLNITSLITGLINSALPQDIENNITNAKVLKPETLDGKQMLVYQFDNTLDQNNLNLTTQTKLWVGAADGLPYQEVIQGNINGIQTTTTNKIDYDLTIHIEDPTTK